MSNCFGSFLKMSTFGESHGYGIGAVLDGCPAGLSLTERDIQFQLNRRSSSGNGVFSDRAEKDRVLILSGLNNGKTLGFPIVLFIKNEIYDKLDYKYIKDIPRPSHADYSYFIKYGLDSVVSGGGRSSGRETAARVASGAIASKFLKDFYGIDIIAWVNKIGTIKTLSIDYDSIDRSSIDRYSVRCPNNEISIDMLELISNLKDTGDSVGGIVSCICKNIPTGWGEPLFNKLEARLAYAMLSIPGSKGFEIGSGFNSGSMRGSFHNDSFVNINNKIKLKKNDSGGVQGGISVCDHLVFKVPFKPPSSINITQESVDFEGRAAILKIDGRHDPCIAPRAVPVVEAMAALVLADFAIGYNL